MADVATTLAAGLIQPYEQCELAPYLDADDVATIGWGNTQWEDESAVTMDDAPISQAEADALFSFWLGVFLAKVRTLVVRGNDYQLAAYTSLAYNIGETAFAHSSTLRQYGQGNLVLAGLDIELWNEGKGRVLKGLQRRRRAEHYVFDGSDPAKAIAQALKDFP